MSEFLGRIITDSPNITTYFYIDKTKDTSCIDNSIPTLIVGKKLAESIYGKDKIHILDRKIDKNIYWTYSRTEKRSECERDVVDFNNRITYTILRKLKYSFLSVYTSQLYLLKRLIKFVRYDKTYKIFLVTSNHVYMYAQSDVIVGISLRELELKSISTDKIINLIKSNPHNTLLNNWRFVPQDLRKYIAVSLDRKLL